MDRDKHTIKELLEILREKNKDKPRDDVATMHVKSVIKPGQKYLTNANLDRSDRISFSPDIYETFSPPPYKIDYVRKPAEKAYGSPAISIDMIDRPMPVFRSLGAIEIFSLLIKKPGEVEHRIPRDLYEADKRIVPLVAKFAGHQFRFSDFAKQKAGFLMIRKHPIVRDFNQIGNTWHQDDGDASESDNYGLSEEDKGKFYEESLVLTSNNYNVSNAAPTWFQTGKNPVLLNSFKSLPGDVTQTDDEIIYKRQAKPYEGMMANQDTFHRAALMNSVETDLSKKFRILVYVGYVPSKQIEREMGIDLG